MERASEVESVTWGQLLNYQRLIHKIRNNSWDGPLGMRETVFREQNVRHIEHPRLGGLSLASLSHMSKLRVVGV